MDFKKKVLLDFIRAYRNSPSLWKRDDKSYTNRTTKDRDYQRLANILNHIEPHATRESVVRKINSLRTTFRKEERKLKDADSTHTSSLWYYKEFLFLRGGEIPEESSLHSHNIEYADTTEMVNDDIFDDNISAVDPDDWKDMENDEDGWTSSTEGEDLDTQLVPKRTQKRKRKFTSHSDEDYSSNHYMKEDEYLIMAKNYAIKLKKMEPLQRLFADRLINEVLLEGQLGTLSKQSVVCVDPPVATT